MGLKNKNKNIMADNNLGDLKITSETKIDLGAPASTVSPQVNITPGMQTKIDLGAPVVDNSSANKVGSPIPVETLHIGSPISLGNNASSTVAAGAVIAGAAVASAQPATLKIASSTPVSAPSAGTSTMESFFSKTNNAGNAAQTTKLLEAIASTKTPGQQTKSILGATPTLQKALDQEKDFRLRKKLRLVQAVFMIVFFASAMAIGYFYSELSPNFNLFGTNTVNKLIETNKNLNGVQSRINKYNYLSAQIYLNRFSIVSNRFFDKTGQLGYSELSSDQKTKLNAQIAADMEEIPRIITELKNLLGKSTKVAIYKTPDIEKTTDDELQTNAWNDVKGLLNEDKKKLNDPKSQVADKEDNVRLTDNAYKLVGNSALVNILNGINPETLKADLDSYVSNPDIAKKTKLQKQFSSILASTKSDVSTVSAIKNSRVNWSTIISQVYDVTRSVDNKFNNNIKGPLYNTLGGILFSGFEIDSNDDKIVLSGDTLYKDGDNFTKISTLIDNLENSQYFKNVEMRSFSKSGDMEKGFTSNFKIDLNLKQSQDDASSGKPISLLSNGGDDDKIGFKRSAN